MFFQLKLCMNEIEITLGFNILWQFPIYPKHHLAVISVPFHCGFQLVFESNTFGAWHELDFSPAEEAERFFTGKKPAN